MLLADQDRTLWDRGLIEEGQTLVRACLRRGQPGPYQIQAAINAVNSDAARATDTRWDQILQLYDQLLEYAPTPVIALNRAVAMAEVHGRKPRWTSSTGSTSIHTSRSTPPAPTCSAVLAGNPKPPPTKPRSR